MLRQLFAPQLVILYALVASTLYVHFRGKQRLRFARQLGDHSTYLAPYNVLMYAGSAVPNTPVIPVEQFPELKKLSDNWETIRDEATRLFDEGFIRAAAKNNDWGFYSFFKSGWKRFYLKWYDDFLPSARTLCPQTVELLNSIPNVHGAMFAMLPPGGKLGAHRDPFAGSLRYHLGLVTPNSDKCRILVDGVDSRQYDPADLRAGIGFAMQDTDLFYGKLRDNIALGKPEATDEEILLAARLSGVESFIAGHPMGYDMPISEGGRSLSGGQKQAIGLARVLIRKPRVLFLDEPTAHFDIRSEQEFLERLKGLRDERMTIIISTHRLSLLNMVDRLLLFDNGRLVADGPRDKVLALLQGKPASTAPAPENTIQPKSA